MKAHSLNIKGKLLQLESPLIMGILNVTPDSFHADSRISSVDSAVESAQKMLKDGADILDIGGYSSRPGAEEVSVEEELNRVLPVVEAIATRFPDAILSIDTFRSSVAEKCIAAGAHIINDISGGEADAEMFGVVARLKVPYILMHMNGSPQTMQDNPHYENVTLDVFKSLSERISELRLKGVSDVIIDQGFGFGKTMEHNFKLLNDLDFFHSLDCPILVGISRKSMIYKALKTDASAALNGTTVLNTIATQKGAHILRVHDVKEAVELKRLYSLMNEA